ncbi:MAG TPA: hypothetical protein VMT34_07775 [Aggregatilineales bacterium]|nr:hypothetical protein [Aggregatilineales bacterium]
MPEQKPIPVATPPQTQTAAIIVLAGVVAIIIGALYLAQATVTATTGTEIDNLAATRDTLQQMNDDALARIAIAKNLDLLRGRAQALGFQPVDTNHQEYIYIAGYSPVRATPTPQITPTLVVVYDETFNGWAKKQWDTLVQQFEAWAGHATPTPAP